ncbi:glycosyltransferase family 39 protein [candidate division KSB1 bacterium]|nr:glycosyltransferase family 39 protein [candidate division KSB1 bacterium]
MNPMNKITTVLILGLLVLAGTGVRVLNLDRASFWVDEVNTVFTAKSLNETGVDTLPSGAIYGRARIYTAIVAASFKLFGVSEFSARMPSVLFGVLSILLAYGLVRIWFDPKTALFTAFFMAFSHFEVGWSRTARMYTLLQFITLWLSVCYIKGFRENHVQDPNKKFFDSISIPWLVIFLVTLGVTTLHIHTIATMLIPGFGLYMLIRAGILLFGTEGRSRWMNPYTVVLVGGGILGGLLIVALPSLRVQVVESFNYTPTWASGVAYAAKKTALLEFLMSPWRMPITVFAFLGSFQLITRKHISGWLPASLFFVPFILLTLVFTHRVEAYLFFVYPYFLMIAAFGLSNWLDSEYEKSPFIKWIGARGNRFLILGMVLFMFVLFPWFRITLKIPKQPDGITNMAVTPEEWRGASQTVFSQKQSDDLIITSLPQVALYYGLTSNYGLNQVNLEQAESKGLVNKKGQRFDLYAGAPCVESLEDLQSIIADHPSGWLLISDFHFTHPQYTSDAVRNYIEETFAPPQMTPQGTVRLYHWTDGGLN